VGDSAEISQWFYNMFLGLDAIILAIVLLGWFVALLKFRKKDGDETLPEQSHGDMRLEVLWTVIPTFVVVAITIPTLGGIFKLAEKPDANEKVVQVEVTGKQWWWEFDYKQGEGAGIHTANELHVPVGTRIWLDMTSADVIHAWWIPRIGGKRDATPGRSYPMYFTAKQVGIFDGQCAELCGASHALMGTKLVVHPVAKEETFAYIAPNGDKQDVVIESYADWVKKEQAIAAKPAAGTEEEAGQKLFQDKGCPACHLVSGFAESAARSRTSGPNLSHVGSRMWIAANTLPNTTENLTKWIENPQAVKPEALMTKFEFKPGEAQKIAKYLISLK
jgi:cytochrome c oxidase subunit 2